MCVCVCVCVCVCRASQVVLVVKNLPANAGDTKDMGSIPGSGRCPRGGHGKPFQYSCLEDTMARGAWWAIVHRVAKSWIHTYTHTDIHVCVFFLKTECTERKGGREDEKVKYSSGVCIICHPSEDTIGNEL